jgi:hypothetical protein
VLRLLPRYYREQWEQDMIGAFLDGWLTGDPELDEYISRVAWPGWAEVTSVAGLAVRLYLGGTGAPRRYFAWGQAVRRAVLAVLLVHAVLAWPLPGRPSTKTASPRPSAWPRYPRLAQSIPVRPDASC